MNKLPILQKNAYLTIVVKNNAIWSHLAYVDYSSEIQYILTDYTDISHLKRRLDDYIFMEEFWKEYFTLLEKTFDWKMFQSLDSELNRVIEFKDENYGLSGVKVLVDDNQDFLTNIFHSISQYSHDITVRVMDTQYIRKIIGKLSEKLDYENLVYIDLDIDSFQIYRVNRENKISKKGTLPTQYQYSEMSQQWSNEIGIIDAIRNRRLRAFLASDLDSSQIQNNWANLILHPVDVLLDPNILDTLRSFTTVQLLSLINDSKQKLSGIEKGNSLIIVGGKIPRLLGKKTTLLTLIDGLELYGNFDVIWDNEAKILAYGISTAEGIESQDIVIGKNEVISDITKVIIPELKSQRAKNKVIFSGLISSQDFDEEKIVVLGDTFELIKVPNKINKVIFEGKFENNVYVPSLERNLINFVSSPLGSRYENILIDSRLRPIVYGTDSYKNKLKINKWLNAN
ncbi:MAG: hypothetical protein PHP08_01080 [Candidatus Dojkabacteria bacterium]|nr:hypothetical protein [Candidatus Dojkabacteria bacterium]